MPGAGAPGRGAGRAAQIAGWRLRAAGAADAGGRTSMGRRGGAGGAWPVFGSSTRSRSVGGTTRPVGGGITGRGGRRRRRRSRGGVAARCRRFFD